MRINPILSANLKSLTKKWNIRLFGITILTMIFLFIIFLPTKSPGTISPISTPKILLPTAITVFLEGVFLFNITLAHASWELNTIKWRKEIGFVKWFSGRIGFLFMLIIIVISISAPLLFLAGHYQDLPKQIVLQIMGIIIITLTVHGIIHTVINFISYRFRVISQLIIWTIILAHLLLTTSILPSLHPIILIMNLLGNFGGGM